jgi:hypothetical protein
MREFDWSYELGMYAGTAAGLLVCFFTVGGFVVLVNLLWRGHRHRRSDKM